MTEITRIGALKFPNGHRSFHGIMRPFFAIGSSTHFEYSGAAQERPACFHRCHYHCPFCHELAEWPFPEAEEADVVISSDKINYTHEKSSRTVGHRV